MSATFEKIVNTGNSGNLVHQRQTMAKSQGFKNVNASWLSRTLTYDQARQRLALDRQNCRDILCTLQDIQPALNGDGVFGLLHNAEGKHYVPTEHALNQICLKLGVPNTYFQHLYGREDKYAHDMMQYCMDKEWMLAREAMKERSEKTRQDGKQSKMAERLNYLFRVRTDSMVLRAMLSEIYARIDNDWILDIIEQEIPEGRVSHLRGDSDTMYGNILVPDSMRKEEDSDYGGLVAIRNCEIGTAPQSIQPGTFRAICFNGCIWDYKQGKSIRKIHRGKIDMDDYRNLVVESIRVQLDLIPQTMKQLFDSRKLTSVVNIVPLIAELAIDNKLDKVSANHIYQGYKAEDVGMDGNKVSLFTLINAATRAAQFNLAPNQAYDLECLAGTMTEWNQNQWDSFTKRASTLDKEQVDKILVAV